MHNPTEEALATVHASSRRIEIWREPLLWLAAIVAVAAFFRLFRLLSLFPILVDESIYLRWAEIIDHQGQWFISLLDAKQPLSYWIYALIRKVGPGADPLLGPRLVSVIAGVGGVCLLFRLGRQLAGVRAGIIAALLYALMPFGVLFDRLAYTDALVNLCGIAITVVSLECFAGRWQGLSGVVLTGMLLGAGFSVKSTFALFAWVPLLVALMFRRGSFRKTAIRLLEIYLIASILPAISFMNVPEAPNFEVNNLLFHHTSFFPPAGFLAAHPFLNAAQNSRLVMEYARCYVTIPLAIGALLSALYLLRRRRRVGLLLLLILLAPLAFEVIALWFVHSRYVFPLAWPLAVLPALAIADLKPGWATLATVGLAIPAVLASAVILRDPIAQLHPVDVDEFLSSGPYSGYGIREAVAYLKTQTVSGPFTLLTDPAFGTPADAFHAYLNLWHGIHVYDAWWLQMPDRPILPRTPTEVMKSQYERVSAGLVDFPSLTRVYYATDTNYNMPAEVAKREPGARPEARFMKRNGIDSIDVYRLR